MRGEAVHLAGLKQRGDDGPVFGSCGVASEDGVLAVQGNGAGDAFDGVVVDLNASIGEEAPEAIAVLGDIGERLAQGRFGRRAGTVVGQPVVNAGEDRGGAILPTTSLLAGSLSRILASMA
jgi:hypothetical protein